jgi:hypothetical protein
MASPPAATAARPPGEGAGALLRAGLILFAGYHLALAVWMAVAPHTFYRAIGPFDAFNSHYIRDTATFNAALGFGFLVAIRRPSWQLPVVAVTTVQFALHTVNHLVDAGAAHPRWTGWFDFVSLLASTSLLVWMWRTAVRANAADAPPAPASTRRAGETRSSQSPLAERSTR